MASRRYALRAFPARVCSDPVPGPALSVSRVANRGPKATIEVGSEPQILGPKLSESLINRVRELTTRLVPIPEANQAGCRRLVSQGVRPFLRRGRRLARQLAVASGRSTARPYSPPAGTSCASRAADQKAGTSDAKGQPSKSSLDSILGHALGHFKAKTPSQGSGKGCLTRRTGRTLP